MRSDPHKVAAAAIIGTCERLATGGVSEERAEADIREDLDRWRIRDEHRPAVLAQAAAYPYRAGGPQALALLGRIATVDDFAELVAAEVKRGQKRHRIALGDARLG